MVSLNASVEICLVWSIAHTTKEGHHVMGKNHGFYGVHSLYHVQTIVSEKRVLFKVLEYIDDSKYEGEVLFLYSVHIKKLLRMLK
jgi:hypothetical protein